MSKSPCSPLKNRHCKIDWTSQSQGKVSSSRGRSKFFFQMSASQLAAWGIRKQRPNAASSFPSAGGKQVGSEGSRPPLQTVLHEHPGDVEGASSPGLACIWKNWLLNCINVWHSDTRCVGARLPPPLLPPVNKSPVLQSQFDSDPAYLGKTAVTPIDLTNWL